MYKRQAYNASSGGHEVNITVNGETITRTLTVLPKDFGTVEVAVSYTHLDVYKRQHYKTACSP